MIMQPPFEPYHIWLGIPPAEQPVDHYRLLGIARFESDPRVIARAAQRRAEQVQTFAVGAAAELSQKVLSQLAWAKLCLLNPVQRAHYDLALREGLIAGAEMAVQAIHVPAEKPRRQLLIPRPRSAPLPKSVRTWIIGSSPDCDVVVALPTVSRRHCRLIQAGDDCLLEDLGSRNGTYVNGRRVTSRVAISTVDSVWLGRSSRMPWPWNHPARAARLVRVGAAPDNDIIFELPIVSWHHALIRIVGGLITIEDLHSTNGTAVGKPHNWIRHARLSPHDVVYFGSLAVPAAKLLADDPR